MKSAFETGGHSLAGSGWEWLMGSSRLLAPVNQTVSDAQSQLDGQALEKNI